MPMSDPNAMEVHAEPLEKSLDRELDFRVILWFFIGLTVMCLLAFAGVRGVLALLEGHTKGGEAPLPAIVAGAKEAMPPEPRLEYAPVASLADLRRQEDAILRAFAWADAEHTHARIPVDRAVEIALAKGFPTRTPSAPEAR